MNDNEEVPLQAVCIADSFSKALRPLTLGTAKCLLPGPDLAPMLAGQLEWLASQGVQETIILCVWRADEVAGHVRAMLTRRVFRTPSAGAMAVRVLEMPTAGSAGNALRELDQLGDVRSDPFVLVGADNVTDIDLSPAIDAHKRRKKIDSNASMTMLLVETGARAALRPLLDDLVVAVDADTNRMLLYTDSIESDAVTIAVESFDEADRAIELRADLMDPRIDLCSPEVLWRFSENFDYQTRRSDFVAMEVANVELGQHVYAHVAPGAYAAQIADLRTHAVACADANHGWCTGVIGGGGGGGGGGVGVTLGPHRAASVRGAMHRDASAVISPTATISTDGGYTGGMVVCPGARIGAEATVSHSVIGHNATVGSGATVLSSHLWTGAVVGDGAVVDRSIVGQGASVGKGARLGEGCVLGAGVVVGDGAVLPPFTRVTCDNPYEEDDGFGSSSSDDDDDGGAATEGGQLSRLASLHPGADAPAPAGALGAAPAAAAVLGAGGVGRVWDPLEEDDADDSDRENDDDTFARAVAVGQVDAVRAQSIGCDDSAAWRRGLRRTFPSAADSDSDSDFGDEDSRGGLSGGTGFGDSFQTAGSGIGAILEESSVDPFNDPRTTSPAPASPGPGGSGSATKRLKNVAKEVAIAERFQSGVQDMLVKGFQCNDDVQSVRLEINCFKLSENRPYADCLAAVVRASIDLALGGGDAPTTPMKVASAVRKQLVHWSSLVKAFASDPVDELAVVRALEDCCMSVARAELLEPSFKFILHCMYDLDLVGEERILEWHSTADDDLGGLRDRDDVKEFVEWLQESDDESGSESE